MLHLLSITGQDFSAYKEIHVCRCIEYRISTLVGINSGNYLDYLKKNFSEIQALMDALLVNLTNFFRDADAFKFMAEKILPQLCKNKTDEDSLEVWVAGCSTGEEAYSIAILVKELKEKTRQKFKVQIYASDLNNHSIAIAADGLYSVKSIQNISTERVHSYFEETNMAFKIKKEIRQMVVFDTHNVLNSIPHMQLDMIACRNLMIYLQRETQEKLIAHFHHALTPDGVLFLSPSESIGNQTLLFTALDYHRKFYTANALEN